MILSCSSSNFLSHDKVISVLWSWCLYQFLVSKLLLWFKIKTKTWCWWWNNLERKTLLFMIFTSFILLCLQVRPHQWTWLVHLTLPNPVILSNRSVARSLTLFRVKRAWETHSAAKTLLSHPQHQVNPLKALLWVLQTSIL